MTNEAARSQAPRLKFQIPKKPHASSPKLNKGFGIWNLGFASHSLDAARLLPLCRLLLRQAVVADLQPAARVDEAAAPFLVLLRQTGGLHVGDALAVGDGLLHEAGSLHEHVAVFFQVGAR